MRGGTRPGAGRPTVKTRKVALQIYVKPEIRDKYRALRAFNQPIVKHLAEAVEETITNQYRVIGIYHLEESE